MKQVLKLTSIGLIGGIILLLVLRLVLFLTGNPAYFLLVNFDYVPILNKLRPIWFFGYVFHFVTCFVSVIALFYILKPFKVEKNILPYIVVYTIGGGALFFLTALSNQPPAADDYLAWFFWTTGHATYGCVIGFLVNKWMK